MTYISNSLEKGQLFHSKKQDSYLAIWRRTSHIPIVTALLLSASTFFVFGSIFVLDNYYGGAFVIIYTPKLRLHLLIISKQSILEILSANLIQSA